MKVARPRVAASAWCRSSSITTTGWRRPSRSSRPKTASNVRASRHSVATTRGRLGSSSSAARRGWRRGTRWAMASPVGPTSPTSVSSGMGRRRVSSAVVNGAYGTPAVAGMATPWTTAKGSASAETRRRVSARRRVSPRPAVPERSNALGLPSAAPCSPIAIVSSWRSRPMNRSLQSRRRAGRTSKLRPPPLRSRLLVIVALALALALALAPEEAFPPKTPREPT